MKRYDIEIMAPVGSYESLAAAIRAGADAVYFGVGKLNMRSASAANFTLDDLGRIVASARKAGVKTYLTVNTIVYEDEIADVHAVIDRAKKEGVDAVIGLHVMNDPIGQIRVCTVPAFSTASDCVWATITGCGTHASMPEGGIDPVMIGSEVVMALHTIVSRNISPDHFAVVSPTVFQAGEVINAIPQKGPGRPRSDSRLRGGADPRHRRS